MVARRTAGQNKQTPDLFLRKHDKNATPEAERKKKVLNPVREKKRLIYPLRAQLAFAGGMEFGRREGGRGAGGRLSEARPACLQRWRLLAKNIEQLRR